MNYLITQPVQSPEVARKLLKQAAELHEGFISALRTAKDRAFECGLTLLNAQASLPPEESFEDLLSEIKGQIARSTAYKYMHFARLVLQWTHLAFPKARDERLIIKAREIVLQSGVSFLELMREARLLAENEGGGRRAPNYSGEQQYFNFVVFQQFTSALRDLDYKPLRQAPPEQLVSMRADLSETVKQIDQLLAEKEAMEAHPNGEKNFAANGHGVKTPQNGNGNGNGRAHA